MMKKLILVSLILIFSIGGFAQNEVYVGMKCAPLRSTSNMAVTNLITNIPRFTKVILLSDSLQNNYCKVMYNDTIGYLDIEDIFNSSIDFRNRTYEEDKFWLLDNSSTKNTLIGLDYIIINELSIGRINIGGIVNKLYVGIHIGYGEVKNSTYSIAAYNLGFDIDYAVLPKIYMGTGISNFSLDINDGLGYQKGAITVIPINLILLDNNIGIKVSVGFPVYSNGRLVEDYKVYSMGVIFRF